ncbi:protein timeless isoform X2 [Hermetia illucens]|uniref:protein timeless isoform X2 n=1 Tax=Hermetia illucens TaxID=343691 RepID=UPI0018CC62D2|nr:protein timeless isoform X2 [Hermetia illucens]
MEWLLANPQIHSTFSSLGAMMGDTYVVSPNALSVLEEINCKLLCEDQTLRTFRRAIGLGQNVKIDIVPLLVNAKDSQVIQAAIRILVNLTVPVECLFSVDVMYRTEVGRHTIFELNKLLITSKEAFLEPKSTKAIIDYMKSILESDTKLTMSQCDTMNNCLLLLRNILHIPENNVVTQGIHSGSLTSMQNTILWNLFTQSVDKLLIYLMSCSQRSCWGVTMVQLIALMYKDQHVSTLQKLLNIWVEASLSESSEDNESNTSPPKQGSGDSSPMLTSDPTSDSSDNGSGKQESADDRRQAAHNKETEATLHEVSRKGHEYQNAVLRAPTKPQPSCYQNNPDQKAMGPPKYPPLHQVAQDNDSMIQPKTTSQTRIHRISSSQSQLLPTQLSSGNSCAQKTQRPSSQSELSDCGYATQVENQESISTSSNEDESPQQKPVHQKPPCNQKQRFNAGKKGRNAASSQDKKESRRKKLVKRSKSNLINMKGLVQHTPTDEDISHILKEFTVDFLLKGYGFLVQELHAQLLSDLKVQIDTSHFFWLVTYFLKFAAQLELEMEHISYVLSFKVVSYLTFEGVNICEQLELNSHQQGCDLKPYLRRMHLVVTAIREFLQALETYKKVTHLSQEDRHRLQILQLQIGTTEDLRCLFVLLLRRYDPALHSKQYLQDLIVTNHILLLLLESVSQYPENKVGGIRMMQHLSQFATVEIMNHYGLLLENFRENGEFVNDCIFTMMHHIGGDLGQVNSLFQPIVLKTYSQIWETEYELCDDWSDLIEYVIHKFMNTPQKSRLSLSSPSLTEMTKEYNLEHASCTWTQEEMDTLYWYYVQSKKSHDAVGKIVKLFCDNGNKYKSRISIIQQLLQQDIINLVEYDDLMKFEDAEYQRNITKTPSPSTSTKESGIEIRDSYVCKASDDIQVLKDRLLKENKGESLQWLQKVLIECCHVKLVLRGDIKADEYDTNILEPIPYHCILKKKSIPLVPWNSEQTSILLYQPFVLLLHKLGFHLPADAGKLFVRIPDFWTADILYSTAQKLGPVNKCELALIKFDLSLLKVEAGQVDELPALQEDTSNKEMFAVPRTKRTNSIIRFTPDGESTPTVPNWLQVVMRSKCISTDKLESSSPVSISPMDSSLLLCQPSTSKVCQSRGPSCDPIDEDAVMQSADSSDESGLQKRKDCLEDKYKTMIAEVYETEDISNCETASVASDLTRMYVSDEEDKTSIGTHFL